MLPILSGIEAVLAGKQEAFSAEYPCHSSDEQRWFLFRVSPLVESQGVVLSHQDISDRKRAEETLLVKQRELERSQTELEELNAKLLMTQETERQRIARELHDDITQRIATVAIDLQGICSVTPGSEASLLAHIHQTGKMAEQITTDLQRLAYQLHPTLLEHSGLEAAVQEHVEEFEARTGLKTKVQIRNLPTALSSTERPASIGSCRRASKTCANMPTRRMLWSGSWARRGVSGSVSMMTDTALTRRSGCPTDERGSVSSVWKNG